MKLIKSLWANVKNSLKKKLIEIEVIYSDHSVKRYITKKAWIEKDRKTTIMYIGVKEEVERYLCFYINEDEKVRIPTKSVLVIKVKNGTWKRQEQAYVYCKGERYVIIGD